MIATCPAARKTVLLLQEKTAAFDVSFIAACESIGWLISACVQSHRRLAQRAAIMVGRYTHAHLLWGLAARQTAMAIAST